jgi:predicted phosphodiesterase
MVGASVGVGARAAWPVSLLLALSAGASGAAEAGPTPPGHNIAFIGDQGLGPESVAVLQLALDEGADAVVHLGDFDYDDDPVAWLAQTQDVLGPCFPFFAVAGNHDQSEFQGYQEAITALLECTGVQWHGEAGRQYAFTWEGIYFVLTTPGLLGSGDAEYVAERLATTDAQEAIWRISGFHVLMEALQIGDKGNQSGWDVYENSRIGGAIIATAHEHSYHRTNLLSDMSSQTVVGEELVITEGETFAFVSGLGGHSIRDQERCLTATPPFQDDQRRGARRVHDPQRRGAAGDVPGRPRCQRHGGGRGPAGAAGALGGEPRRPA